jgi:hypothetical protein
VIKPRNEREFGRRGAVVADDLRRRAEERVREADRVSPPPPPPSRRKIVCSMS